MPVWKGIRFKSAKARNRFVSAAKSKSTPRKRKRRKR